MEADKIRDNTRRIDGAHWKWLMVNEKKLVSNRTMDIIFPVQKLEKNTSMAQRHGLQWTLKVEEDSI